MLALGTEADPLLLTVLPLPGELDPEVGIRLFPDLGAKAGFLLGPLGLAAKSACSASGVLV